INPVGIAKIAGSTCWADLRSARLPKKRRAWASVRRRRLRARVNPRNFSDQACSTVKPVAETSAPIPKSSADVNWRNQPAIDSANAAANQSPMNAAASAISSSPDGRRPATFRRRQVLQCESSATLGLKDGKGVRSARDLDKSRAGDPGGNQAPG